MGKGHPTKTKKAGDKWSKEDIKKVVKRYRDRKPRKEIGAELDQTDQSVRLIIWKYNKGAYPNIDFSDASEDEDVTFLSSSVSSLQLDNDHNAASSTPQQCVHSSVEYIPNPHPHNQAFHTEISMKKSSTVI